MSDIETLRGELKVIFDRLRQSDEFDEGFFAAMAGVEEPSCRYETASDQWDDFFDGHEVGLRMAKFIKGELP